MKKKLILIVALIVVLIIAYEAYSSLFGAPQPNAEVATTTPEKGDIENTVTATGTVSPKSYVDVGAQVSGQIMRLYYDVGDEVKKGALLAEIDDTQPLAQVSSIRAQLAAQRANLKDKEAQLVLARLTFKRQGELLKANATSEENFDQANASLLSAEAGLEMTKSQIMQIESSLKESEANLQYTKIYAPMSGTIATVAVKEGQTVNANMNTPTILQIADLSTVTISADVSEADVTKLKKGMEVYFTTLGSAQKWRTKLLKIEPTPTVTNNVVLYRALFDVDNSDGALMVSMTTQVFFVLSSAKDALMVPITAISKHPANETRARVMVQTAPSQFASRPIQLGVSNRVMVQVTSGLGSNDTIASVFTAVEGANRTRLSNSSGRPPGGPMRMR
jgi:macrolide-specific efflux system membrane fusion protein